MIKIEDELVKIRSSCELEMFLMKASDYPLYLQGFACTECGAHQGEECDRECLRWQLN